MGKIRNRSKEVCKTRVGSRKRDRLPGNGGLRYWLFGFEVLKPQEMRFGRDIGDGHFSGEIRKTNADECLMTRLQEMSLDYHFCVEQEVGSSTYSFFGFYGTAEVWRIRAIHDAGGWKDRTTVEDMDLDVQANLKGWKFVFVGDLTISCPIRVLLRPKDRGALGDFLLLLHVIPVSVLVPNHIRLTKPVAIYIPATITLLNAVCTPRSLHLVVFWILFENVMSLHRTKAAIIGLLEANRVNEWVVTEKLGNTMKQKKNAKLWKRPRFRIGE
ncbi:hypothetical protein ACJRO7_001247, partial [Eucalyptus globulus]